MMLAGGTLGGVLRHPDPPLSDGVVTLRAKARADVDALTAACQDPEIPRWTRVPVPYRRADALGWIAATELELASGLGIDWLAVDAEDRAREHRADGHRPRARHRGDRLLGRPRGARPRRRDPGGAARPRRGRRASSGSRRSSS